MEKIKQASRREFHFIYKTICNITQKYYIGMHSTDNLDDGYLGSGTRLSRSIKKHGKNNHSIEITEHFQDRESLKERERELVNEDILIDPMCMNLALGGGYQWPLSQTPKAKLYRKESLKLFWSSDIGINAKVKISDRVTGTTRSIESKIKSSNSAKVRIQNQKDSGEWEKVKEKNSLAHIGKIQSQETRDKRIKSTKERYKIFARKKISDLSKVNISKSLNGNSRNKKTWILIDVKTGEETTIENLRAWLRITGYSSPTGTIVRDKDSNIIYRISKVKKDII